MSSEEGVNIFIVCVKISCMWPLICFLQIEDTILIGINILSDKEVVVCLDLFFCLSECLCK